MPLSVPFPYCTADDWGLTPATNDAIVELAERGLIRRVSMMPEERFFTHRLGHLLAIPRIQCGLHLNLIHNKRVRSVAELLSIALNPLRRDRVEILDWTSLEVRVQLRALRDAGVIARHFDSHQHAHVIPGLLERWFSTLKANGIEEIRAPLDWALLPTFRFPLVLFAHRARVQIGRAGFRALPFAYPTLREFRDKDRFREFLTRHRDKEIITHPAVRNDLGDHGVPSDYKIDRVLEYRRWLEI